MVVAAPSQITISTATHSPAQSFWRKTQRGKVQKVLREHYLRPSSSFPPPPSHPHWLVVDTNVILHQLDLLSHPSFPLPLLVPQTVLDEVRHRSLPLFNRLKALIEEELPGGAGKRGWVSWNEAMEETFLTREEGESPNDRNDRAIRHLAAYYSSILSSSSETPAKRQKTSATTSTSSTAQVTLLTDDADNRRKALASGIAAVSVKAFVESLNDELKNVLMDLLANEEEILANAKGRKTGRIYEERIAMQYLAPSVLQAGIKAGKLFQGHFNPSVYNYKEATVSSGTIPTPILLSGLVSMNRAVAGDIVVVQLLPEDQWKGAADDVVDEETSREGKMDDPDTVVDAEEGETPAEKKEKQPSKEKAAPQPTGKVVGIIKRNWRTYVCHLDRSSLPPSALSSTTTQTPIFASPVSRIIPRIRILTRQALHLSTQKFLVSIDSWPATSKYPEGHFVKTLGEVGSKEGELQSLLEEWEVPYRPFSEGILECLPKEGDKWVVPPKDNDPKGVWVGREDFREMIVCSIDPVGCQDIDDALHARRLPNGNIEAGVHIADVSHFVHPDNAMDAEAASRGTTVYLVDKRIDMLPHLLGTNLCSLRPYVERLAFSVIWEIDDEANIVNVRFTKSVIASKEAFTYQAAQERHDDNTQTDALSEGIRLLNKIAIQLKAKRMAAGALNLASPEVKIHMESNESSDPVDVQQKVVYQTMSLVEEFMLLANCSVAARIYEQFPQTAVLRRHAPPPKTNFEVLQDVLAKRRGLSLDVSTSGALAASLDQCIDPNLPSFNTLVRIMATRCMLSAEYFCSGSIARDAFGHYGLASPIYTHFTSPIRRYADVLVHRQLAAAVSGNPLHAGLQTKAFVEKTLDLVNKRHRSAQQAARASIEFYVALALKNKEEKAKVRSEAFVIRAFRNGLAVFVSEYGLEGLVTFKRDNEYDAETYEIAVPTDPTDSKSPAVRIGVFDKVTVEITTEKDKNTQRGRVVMTLVDPVDSRGL
ncbi:exosome complex exonuclease DIS3/RRP44 [Pseudohyphozyma bogoriensis]|nr:exosome complex exonuclease DIS3/RRP44 [Pseudohyphozyma bogoriensis]